MCAERREVQRPGDAVCVFCRKHPVAPDWRPFCSERCKLQDLARWADGAYRVTGDPLPDPGDEGSHL